jgi:hypothetical protein
MLAAVLLHVIEAPVPVNSSLHCANSNRLVDHLDYFLFFVKHIHDTRISKPPDIVRLAAGSGIKRGAIKFHAPQRARRSF